MLNYRIFELTESESIDVKIKVIGVGGGGENAVNSMIAASLSGIDFIVIDTNIRKLENSAATTKVQIGTTLTRGLGAGARPVIGQQAAIEGSDSIKDCLKDADMVFITAGMGGGTGTGAAPVVAGIAKEMGILTIAVVTKPFYYEGRTRALNAEAGIKELKKNVDAYIVIPNDKIHLSVPKGTSLLFAKTDKPFTTGVICTRNSGITFKYGILQSCIYYQTSNTPTRKIAERKIARKCLCFCSYYFQ